MRRHRELMGMRSQPRFGSRTLDTLGGLMLNGHFVYRAGGKVADALCGPIEGPFKPEQGVTCSGCWRVINRARYRQGLPRGGRGPA